MREAATELRAKVLGVVTSTDWDKFMGRATFVLSIEIHGELLRSLKMIDRLLVRAEHEID